MATEAPASPAPNSPTATSASTSPAPSKPTTAANAASPSPQATKPAPGSTPAGTAAGGTQAAGTPEKPEESEGTAARRLVREQRERVKAEKRAAELEAKIKVLEGEGDPFKRAVTLWKEGKRAQAVKTGFGVQAFDDDLLIQLASDEPEAAQPLTPEQMREQIRQELEEQRKAEEAQRTQQLQSLRTAAVKEVGAVLTSSPDKWPTVWAIGITADDLADAIDASYDPKTGQTMAPEALFDEIEKQYRAKVQGLPWLAKPESPQAPRSFGDGSRRGPVDTADAPKPASFEERQRAREQREREFRERHFGAARG